MRTSKKVNFLIVGVARCGTTSLFHYLEQHPQIGFPKIKEPKYFSSLVIELPQNGIGDQTVDEKMITDWETYQNLFIGMEDLLTGEASSDYFYYHNGVIPLIKNALGDIPIIISLRNPYERAFSAYNNLTRDGRESLSFLNALHAEKERIRDGWDWMWHYTTGSLYAEGVFSFQENFSKVKIILFDDLKRPLDVLHDITDFLGLERFDAYNTDTRYSPSGKPKNLIIKMLSSRKVKPINWARKMAIEKIPRHYLEKISENFFKKDELPNDIIGVLRPIFEPDIAKLETLIDRDLSHWKKQA